MNNGTFNRREFIKGATVGTMALLVASEQLLAEESTPAAAPSGPAVGCGIIGLGLQGKEIVSTLSKMSSVSVAGICDTYEPYIKKTTEIAPKAATFTEYKKLLENKDVQAVFVATPSHLHKQIVLDAIQAGKHVYCEGPMANTLEDAKAIALAAQGCKQVFQVGQQLRSSPLYNHVVKFMKNGALGDVAETRAQWHKRNSWKRAAPSAEREAELNWRISKATSAGLMGEVGVHHIDLMNWYLDALPVSVTGFGGITAWNDGRDVPDTVQCVFEYPGNKRFVFDATLVNSFEGTYNVLYGSSSAILLRERVGWMFRETDSSMLGWEVYARKEKIGDETGIALIADSTKYLKEGKEPGKDAPVEPGEAPLYSSVQSFINNTRGGEKSAACGVLEAYRATVAAIKANEAVLSGTKITFDKEGFELK